MFVRKLFRTLKLSFKSPKTRTPTYSPIPVCINLRYASTSITSENTTPDPAQETGKSPFVPKLNGMSFVRTQNISTLDPSKLVASDFIELRRYCLTVRYRHISGIYYRYAHVDQKNLPFPPKTCGFLYLHRPHGVHPCAATLRFRICDKDLPPQESFARGKDLLLPKGAPWQVNMFTLFKSGWTRNFRESLLADKMLSLEAIEQIENLTDNLVKEGEKETRLRSDLVFSFGQPVHFSMKQRTTGLTFVNLKAGKLQRVDIFTRIAKCTDKTLRCTMCIEYDPDTKNRMVFRILQIPKELHGKTRYNVGDVMPFKSDFGFPVSDVVNALLEQSSSLSSFSLPSHPD